MTHDDYQATQNLSKGHGADIWPPYKDLVHWKNQNACPHDITANSRDEAVPLGRRLLTMSGSIGWNPLHLLLTIQLLKQKFFLGLNEATN